MSHRKTSDAENRIWSVKLKVRYLPNHHILAPGNAKYHIEMLLFRDNKLLQQIWRQV